MKISISTRTSIDHRHLIKQNYQFGEGRGQKRPKIVRRSLWMTTWPILHLHS